MSKDGNNSKRKAGETQTLALLQKIKKGSVDPKSISPVDRQWLVMFLTAEGQSVAEIAHLLGVSDKTIERDRKTIRQGNAISQDPELANIMAGKLFNEAQTCIQRIRKFQRDSHCPPAARIEGERACFQITNDLTERLQSMGHLPTAARKLEADLVHHADAPLSLGEISSEVQRLREIRASLPENRTKKIESRTVEGKPKNNDQA